MRRLLAVLLFVCAQAHAGFSANHSGGGFSPCYLTSGMAIQSAVYVNWGDGHVTIDSMVVDPANANHWTWSGMIYGYYRLNGEVYTCATNPLGGVQPTFSGPASDPGIVEGGVAGGSSGGSSSITFPDIFNIDADGGAQIGAVMLGILALAWVFRSLIRAFSVDNPSA